MKHVIAIMATSSLLCSCTTLNESLKLGAATGAFTGAAATYAAQRGAGQSATLEDAAIGASVGLGLGLVISYFIHEEVAEDRAAFARETDMYFGDLPPSPFVVPKTNSKKGGR